MPPTPHPSELMCKTCHFKAKNLSGLKWHQSSHKAPTPPPEVTDDDQIFYSYVCHKVFTGQPIDANGNNLPPHALPAPDENAQSFNSWALFQDQHSFDFANLFFTKIQASAPLVDEALDLFASMILHPSDDESGSESGPNIW
ncbi:hypothetical protein BDQ17DRAFT_1334738 [Cyathus striatus]|nr:hypothetical protein BDQ17DRAFT_1334738 [Cyathus striatus]